MRKAKEVLDIVEFANVPERIHRFGVGIKLHIYQPTDKKLKHTPRLKVFRKDLDNSFIVRLSNEANKIEIMGGNMFLFGSDLKKVMDGIVKYRGAFLKFYNDPTMDLDELDVLLREVDDKENK